MSKFLSLLLFVLVSCGDSPILNHQFEKNGLLRNASPVESEGTPFKNVDFSFSIDWKTGPQLGESNFTLKSWKTNSGTFNGPYSDLPYDLKVVLWMPTMGHGSSPTKVTELASGEYLVSNVYFIMNGAWEMKVQLIKDGKLFDEVVLPYNL